MDIIIRKVFIVDPFSPFHHQSKDILIQNGFITEVGDVDRSVDETIDVEGLNISPGWIDVFANFCDPGYEFKETLSTGAQAAAAGGYTDVFLVPNTNPVIQNKGGVEYLVNAGNGLPVNLHPIGAISKNAEGKELSEMYDMSHSGAICFSDGIHPVQSSGILLKALQYVKGVNKTIIQLPEDRTISKTGLMNEGIMSTKLGLPGMPSIAEEIQIARDIELAKYTGSKIHFTGISTAGSIQLIKKAKEDGIAVSCSVTPYHLFFSDEDLAEYDTNLKVNPPLRTKTDVALLRKAVLDGIIDCIATHHLPQDTDHKLTEFEYAENGMIGLETSFAAVQTAIPELSVERIVELFSASPRKIFGLPSIKIDKGQPASLSLFLPQKTWMVNNFNSKSHNSAFKNMELKGRPLGIINKDKVFLNQL